MGQSKVLKIDLLTHQLVSTGYKFLSLFLPNFHSQASCREQKSSSHHLTSGLDKVCSPDIGTEVKEAIRALYPGESRTSFQPVVSFLHFFRH